jgi:hypothetical protein
MSNQSTWFAAWRVLLSKIARSGHTSTQIGTAVVIIGGILRDQGPVSDILIADCQGLTVRRYVLPSIPCWDLTLHW